MKIKKENGITLISLIITIIIMLILAGVVLSITLGENGILKTAKYSVQKNSEETAREKLELALADLTSHKYTNEDYDENDYIDNYLKNEDMTVVDNVVTVDNWNFEIDRSVPCIKSNLGESEIKLTKEVKSYLGKNSNDKYEVSVLVKIESNLKIESAELENTDGTTLTVKAEEEKMLTKDIQIELDREYKITVKMANGKTISRIVIERSVENIKTVEELVAFRDKVNSGLTYEGKTINLVADLDLSSVCYKVDGTATNDKSWEPIGNYGTDTTHTFKGTFNGNYYKIENLYINSEKSYQALFGYAQKATIIGVVIEQNSSITGNSYVGSIAGKCTGNIKRCVNYGKINSAASSSAIDLGGIVGRNEGTAEECYNISNVQSNGYAVGGICGENYSGTIKNCYSIGNVNTLGHDSNSHSQTGGITGNNVKNATVENVYHIGEVSAKYTYVGGIVGYNGNSSAGKQTVKNVFQVGTVKYGSNIASSNIGSGLGTLIGRYQTLTGKYGNISKDTIKGWDEDTIKTNLGDSFTKDINNINNGYPILKWQVENK